MKIIKPQSLGVLHKPYTFLGKHYLSIATIGFFRLGADNPRFLTENLQWPHVVASLPPAIPLDDVMPKQQPEVLLLGSAYAPHQQACTSLMTQLRLDDAAGKVLVSKCLCIQGERHWQASFLGARRVSKPQAFTSMMLSYRRAFGGANSTVNPEGCGARPLATLLSAKASGSMPNIGYPAGIASDWRNSVAAGFGPIPMTNRARRRKFGTYGKAWRDNDAPGFARDMDWSIYNMAPPDQWAGAQLHGGESYLLRNLHPRHAELTGKLPTLCARAFVLPVNTPVEQARPVDLRMDTVWFLPDYDLGIVLYHGKTEISDSDALDIGVLMVAYEDRASPKSTEHYRQVMALRLDKASAMLHVFNESQLAPLPDAATQKRREQEQKAAENAVLARSQERIDLLDAHYWNARGTSAPADHRTARATLPVLGVMTARTAAEGDFDLSDIVTKARTLAAQVEQQGKEALARIPPLVPFPVDQAALVKEVIDRAAVPAYDLLPPGQTGSDPVLSTMLAGLPLPDPADAVKTAAYNATRANLMQIPARRRQSRRAAPKLVLPALPYPQTVASTLGEQVQNWLRAGIPLAGRDLAGASLVGVDFSGADLREVMFDGADLSYARFTDADLQGAVLVGAQLEGVDFSKANLRQANLCASHGSHICFDGADMTRAQAIDAQWPQASLRSATLRRLLALRLQCPGAVFDYADLGKATLFNIHADDTSWRQSRMEKTVFLRASLQRSDFRQSQLCKVVFNDAQLQHSRWDDAILEQVQGGSKSNWNSASMTGTVLKKCGFHAADLAHVDAREAQFLRCDFSQADLRWGQLDGGQFSYCGFMKADLRLTSAQGAEFFQCVCRKTNFSGAIMTTTVFTQCERTGAIAPDDINVPTGSLT